MKIITTKVRGWQKLCLEWAMAGNAFEVLGVEKKHILFFQELCEAYRGKYKYFSQNKFVLRFPQHSH